MLKLAAVFENAAGKKHSWSFNEPDPNKSPEEIRSILEAMTTLHLFEKDGIRQFCKVVSAKFVETIETPLFDLSKPTPEAYVADPTNVFTTHIVPEGVNQVLEMSVVEEVKPEKVAVEATVEKALTSGNKGVVATKAVNAAVQPLEKKETVLSPTAPVITPTELTAMIEKATKPMTSVMPGRCVQQLEAIKKEADSSEPATPAPEKPINPRKAQVDRLRAYHEANKKKKRSKKKKR